MINYKFKQKSIFYKQLHSYIKSGFSYKEAQKFFKKENDRKRMNDLSDILVYERKYNKEKFSKLEYYSILNANKSGYLEETFLDLYEYYKNLNKALSNFYSKMIYPLFLIVLASVLLNISILFKPGNNLVFKFGASFIESLFFLSIFPALIVIVIFLLIKKLSKNDGLESVIKRVPILRDYWFVYNYKNFVTSLRNFWLSGVGVGESLELSGIISDSPQIIKSTRKMREKLIDEGCSLYDLFKSQEKSFDSEFIEYLGNAEQSGTIDEALQKWGELYSDKFNENLATISGFLGKSLTLIVMLSVGYKIVISYNNILNDQLKILD